MHVLSSTCTAFVHTRSAGTKFNEYRCSISSPLHVPGTLQLYVPGSLHTAVVYLPTAAAGTAVP